MKKIHQITIDIITHFVLTMTISAWIYLQTKIPVSAGIFILGGIFIDLDHLIDYFLFTKNKFILSDFLNIRYVKSGKVYLFLHSWELIFGILALVAIFNSHGLYILFLGMSLHLLIDNVQRKNPLAYFLIYRFIQKFNATIILPELN